MIGARVAPPGSNHVNSNFSVVEDNPILFTGSPGPTMVLERGLSSTERSHRDLGTQVVLNRADLCLDVTLEGLDLVVEEIVDGSAPENGRGEVAMAAIMANWAT